MLRNKHWPNDVSTIPGSRPPPPPDSQISAAAEAVSKLRMPLPLDRQVKLRDCLLVAVASFCWQPPVKQEQTAIAGIQEVAALIFTVLLMTHHFCVHRFLQNLVAGTGRGFGDLLVVPRIAKSICCWISSNEPVRQGRG